MKIAIAAAGGNVGSRIVQRLSKTDASVVLLTKSSASLEKLGINTSQYPTTDISNPKEVLQSTKGVDALFWLVPPVLSVPSLKSWYQKVTAAGILAMKENRIKKVVLLSSLGAGAKDNLGTVSYVGDMEEAFDQLDAHVLALRPGYFMENFFLQAQSIFENGTFSFPYAADHAIPLVSTDDIGDTAAQYLLSNKWSGHWKLNLMGPESITMPQAAMCISKALGRKIEYRQTSLQATQGLLAAQQVSEIVQRELIDLFVALGDPKGVYATPRTAEAYTPTSLEHMIKHKLRF